MIDIQQRRRPGCGAAAAAALWRRPQMWIERRLLSTGQTDRRTDGHPTVTQTLYRVKFYLPPFPPPPVRPGGAMVRALDFKFKGRRFDSRPFRFHITTLGKLFTHTPASVTKQ